MIGKTILHYKITEKLGQGGMGAVYKAEDSKLHRTVALKFLPPQALSDEGDRERFIHEARAAAALQHPNICTIFEINEADDQIFISMAYFSEGSLKERIEGGSIGAEETLKIAAQIARGLQAAHEKQIVHRDIKPSNIMFSENGVATVLDFGLAKSKQQTHVTKLGTTMGTIAYMSPEQTRGGEVDHRTDIWSLGVMLYEMTTGRRPFRGDYDEAVIYSILNEPPTPVEELRKDVDPNLAFIIRKAMAKNPAERYQSAAEMREDLEAAIDEIKIGSSKSRSVARAGAFPAGRSTRSRRFANKRVILPAALALIVAAVIMLVKIGGGRGGVTDTVAVVDEQGRTVERAVPKSEYRRSFAVYFFDDKSNDPKDDWVGTAVALLLDLDLSQDEFLNVRSAFDPFAIDRLQRAGFKSWEQAPWSFKERLANDSHLDYLVTGTVSREGGDLVLTRTLHDATTGSLVTQTTHRGADLFALIDEMSVALKRDLRVPDAPSGKTKDLPVAEITTNSLTALEAVVRGAKATVIDKNWPEAIKFYEQAVAADSTAAIAYFDLLQLYIDANRGDKINRTLDHLMRHLYKMPERSQFLGKYAYYLLRKEPEKAFAVLRMMIDLYPEDVGARQALAVQLGGRNRLDEAIQLYQEILEIDPNRTECLQKLGELHRRKGDTAKALECYEAYAQKYPTDVDSFREIAETYMIVGDYDRAMKNFEKALLLEPQDVSVLNAVATIDDRLGRPEEALKNLRDALALSKSSQERIEVHASIQTHYIERGELEKSFGEMRLKWAEMEKARSPVDVMITKLMDAIHLIEADRKTEAFEIIENVHRNMQPPYDALVPIGYAFAYLELENADSAEAALKRLVPFIEAYQVEQLRPGVFFVQGRIAEIRRDYREAIASFEKRIAASPTEVKAHIYIGRCQRQLGELDDAEASFAKVFAILPNDPKALYEYALLQFDKGEKEKAVETLRKALVVWESADPEYKPAAEARRVLGRWTA
jgi:tetratricopeptide (TPR) repeat protein/tRNA A-37 threonylcarbamoyl transferase component Bud32/TolB-like protein